MIRRAQALQRRLSPPIIFSLTLFLGISICAAGPRAQMPSDEINMECTAIAFAPDGRLAFSTRHVYTLRNYEVQRDDIWVREKDGRTHKIVNGEKLVQGQFAYGPFSYAINKIRWSPDGQRLTAELFASQLVRGGGTHDERDLLLISQDGKEIKFHGGDSIISDALDGTWLSDSLTIGYLAQSAKSSVMFSVGAAHVDRGRGGILYEARPFSAISWNAKKDSALAIDLGSSLNGTPQLVLLNLVKEDHTPIIVLDNFHGGLSFSPSGDKAAYFTGSDVLEVREIAHPNLVARAHALFGSIAWAPDESRLLIKEGLEREDGQLFWVTLPATSAEADAPISAAPAQPELGGKLVREFALSPDGHTLAIVLPGSRHVQLLDLK
jgi:dipeptidyl aminopeptidase/acylaminoacyl peptidase